eukprot:360150-Pelagomonas_calceolata.AAC.1
MLFTKQGNPQASAEYMRIPLLAVCHQDRQFASEHHLTGRPHIMLWLTRAFAFHASMCACHAWLTTFIKEAAEMGCLLQNYASVLISSNEVKQ